MTDAIQQIQNAILHLDQVCDGAHAQDAVGFNGVDSNFGKSLAHQIRLGKTLSDKQLHYANKMLTKYAKQLAAAGITLPKVLDVPWLTSPSAKIAPQIRSSPYAYKGPSEPRVLDAPLDSGDVTISLKDKTLIVAFPYHPDKVAAIKTLPTQTRKFHPPDKTWHITLDQFEALKHLFPDAQLGDGFNGGTILAAFEKFATERAENLAASSATAADLIIPGFGLEPYPFQKAGIAYAVKNKRVMIADQMGTGKSIQALGVTQLTQSFPALIVCPASLKFNWKREAERCIPTRLVQIAGMTMGGFSHNADIVIINYDVLGKFKDRLMAVDWKIVVFDESHLIRNSRTQRGQHSRDIAKGKDRVLMMSGTPLVNRPQELLFQLEVLGQLDELGGWWHLATTYCGYKQGQGFASAPEHLDEFNKLLRERCYVRRLKRDVLKELPPKVRTIVPMQIDNRAEYTELENEPIGGEPGEHLALIEKLKQCAARGKMSGVIEWVSEFLDSGEKLILFAWHRNVAEELAATFAKKLRYPVPLIIGSVDKAVADSAVQRFQNDERCRLIVLNIASGGVGLTLTAASNVAFVEFPWTPAEVDQSEDRAHRIGQTDTVNTWFLVAENTIDEKICDLIASKRAVVDEASDGMIDTSDAKKYTLVSEIIKELKRKQYANQKSSPHDDQTGSAG